MPIGIHGSLTHNKVLPMPLGVAARTPTPGPNDISRPKTAKRVLVAQSTHVSRLGTAAVDAPSRELRSSTCVEDLKRRSDLFDGSVGRRALHRRDAVLSGRLTGVALAAGRDYLSIGGLQPPAVFAVWALIELELRHACAFRREGGVSPDQQRSLKRPETAPQLYSGLPWPQQPAWTVRCSAGSPSSDHRDSGPANVR